MKRSKEFKRKVNGFTLIELISVVSIMAIILLIAIPAYTTITNKTKENIYQSKVTELLAKAESYSETSNVFVMEVSTLMQQGLISADNESGNLIDPRSDRKMNCDIIEVNYEGNTYKANYIENDTCLGEEELNNRYGMGYITIYDENGNEVSNNTWSQTIFENFQFRLKNESNLENLVSFTWNGEEEKTCTKEEYDDCLYQISAQLIKNITVTLHVVMNINGQEVNQKYSAHGLIDREKPTVSVDDVNNENYTTDLRKVSFVLDDRSGSGISHYAVVSDDITSCDNDGIVYQSTEDVHPTVYLNNGDYIVCAKDKVGNVSDIDDKSKVHVEKVNSNNFKIKVTNNSNSNWTNKDVTLAVSWDIENIDFCTYKLNDGEYQRYNGVYDSKGFTFKPNFTGEQKTTVYFMCYDKAGNKSNEANTSVLIDTNNPTITYSIQNQAVGSNSYYKGLTLKADVKDNLSGISSIKYCQGEGDCTPGTTATGSFSVTLASGKNRKVCTIVVDKAGNSSGKVCSSSYNVDGVKPTISLNESSTSGENGWVKKATITGSFNDTVSGLASAKYCRSSANCTPDTTVSISNNQIVVDITNASNQKVCMNVTDKAGNTSNLTCSKNYYADNTLPTVSIDVSTSNGNATVTASNAKDNLSGVASYQFRFDNGNWITGSSNRYTFTNLTDGNHTFYVRVKDKAGNYSSAQSKVVTISNGPSLTRIGDFISKNASSNDNMRNNYNIVPLNQSQIVIIDGDEVYYDNGKPKNTYYLEAQVLNVTSKSSSYGSIVKLMSEGAPLPEYGVRVDNSTIVVGGDANTRGGSVRVATLKISGNSITMPYISSVFGKAGFEREGIVGISHSLNSGTVGVYYDDSTSSKHNYAVRSYTYTSGGISSESKLSRNVNDIYYYFHDIYGTAGSVSTSQGTYARQKVFDYAGFFNGTGIVRCDDNSIYQDTQCYNKKNENKIIDAGNYSKYLGSNTQQAYFSMTALGNDKIILTIKNKTYDRNSKTTTLTGHLLFYKKENGSWNFKKEITAPENGATYSGSKYLSNEVLLPLTTNAALYNSYAGLYYITFS